tara:strand:- start:325 stop:546 length:222 start_codon:yes stop_codon:yes gene_type:complete
LDNLNFIPWIKVKSNLEWLQTTILIVMKNEIPIVLFGREYWNKIINFEYLADLGLISDEHLNLFENADTASEE